VINNINKYHYLILLLIISIFTGCSNAIKQARLDRFNNKLESNELKLTEKFKEDLVKRDDNLTRLKKDVELLGKNTTDMRKNYHKYLQTSFKRHSKSVKYDGMVQLLSYEIEMLGFLQEKEGKLNRIKTKLDRLGSKDEDKIIKLLKAEQNQLKKEMETIYIDISWFENSGRINILDAKNTATLLNESLIFSQEGNYNLAIEKITQANELVPGIPIIYAQLGSLYFLTNNKKLALEFYKKANQIEPSIKGIPEMIAALELK